MEEGRWGDKAGRGNITVGGVVNAGALPLPHSVAPH